MSKTWSEQLQDYVDARMYVGGCLLKIIGVGFGVGLSVHLVKTAIEYVRENGELILDSVFVGICWGLVALLIVGALGISFTHYNKFKDVIEAQKVYKQQRQQRGAEHKDTLTALNNLAVEYNNVGKYKKALSLNLRTYTLRCRVLGDEHEQTVLSLINMALVYSNLNECRQSQELLEKAYEQQAKTLGETDDATLTTLVRLSNLAVKYGKQKDYERSAALHEKVYHIRQRVLGEHHEDTQMSYNEMIAMRKKLEQIQ